MVTDWTIGYVIGGVVVLAVVVLVVLVVLVVVLVVVLIICAIGRGVRLVLILRIDQAAVALVAPVRGGAAAHLARPVAADHADAGAVGA